MSSWRCPLVALVVLVIASEAGARCGDVPSDAQAIADARAAVAATCACDTASNHGAYVECARGVIDARLGANLLRRECAGTVRRCAARSTCGRPGFVSCCLPRPGGTRCRVVRNAARCTAAGGVAGVCASCCDACEPGCGSTTTSTITTTTTTLMSTTTITSTTTTSSFGTTSTTLACGGSAPECNGFCENPGLFECQVSGDTCSCVFVAGCLISPTCNGSCPTGLSCVPVGPGACNCRDFRCGSFDLGGACAIGLCPAGETCTDVGGACECVP